MTDTKTDKRENYIGLTADTFKIRIGNHKKSFNHEQYKTESELSKHIWKLKEDNIGYKITWKIIDRGKSFNPVTKICQLCTKEKYYLIFKPEMCSLNSRNELGAHCRHKRGLLHSTCQEKKRIQKEKEKKNSASLPYD